MSIIRINISRTDTAFSRISPLISPNPDPFCFVYPPEMPFAAQTKRTQNLRLLSGKILHMCLGAARGVTDV